MSIPVVGLLPFGPARAAAANGDGGASKGGAFDGLLSSLTQAPSAQSQPGQAAPTTADTQGPRQALTQLLSQLSGGKVDLTAPGLGLTAQQQQQLLTNLQKLLDGNTENGAELLASLLAASHLAAMLPQDMAALTQLLGTTAQGTVSVAALGSNLHLLTQAVQLVASSGGQMTLVQAVQELTPPGDAFAKQLASAVAQQQAAGTSEAPATVDTGPPQGPSPGDAAKADAASATAGSNGREMTVTPNGATSPADGAAEEVTSQGASPSVSDLAKAIEALLQSQPKPATAAAGQAPAGQAAAAGANAGQPVTQPSPGDQQAPAVQLAQMSPAAAQASAKTAPAPASTQTQPANGAPLPSVATQPSAPDATAAASGSIVAAVAPRDGAQDHATDANAGHPHADGSTLSGQAALAQVAGSAPTSFSAALDATSAAADAPARPALEQTIVDQIVQNASLALNSGQQEFRIQLKPEFLGAIEVRVSVDNGVVDVRMSVQSAATRQLIDNNIGQLRQAFGNGDVRVQHVPNFAGSDATWTFAQGGGQQQAFWQGQAPYGGSRLPDAVPFSGGDSESGGEAAVAVAAAPASTAPTRSAPGEIDLQA